jgi:hypothetical protein
LWCGSKSEKEARCRGTAATVNRETIQEELMTEAMNLNALEQRLEQEIQRWENSAINIGRLLNQIKESEAYREAGYRYFQPYYRDRWEQRIGRTWRTAETYMEASRVVDDMQQADHDRELSRPVTDFVAARKLGGIEDSADRIRVWNEHVDSGEPVGGQNRANLDRRIKEYKGEPTVGDALKPEDMADLPPREMPKSQKLYHRTSEIAAAIEDLDPAEVAAHNTNPKLLEANIQWAERISAWYAEYADELKARRNQPLRVVGGER